MNQLSKAVQSQAKHFTPEPDAEEMKRCFPEGREMQDAAAAWAKASLETFTGELLNKALAISAAMTNFTAELAESK